MLPAVHENAFDLDLHSRAPTLDSLPQDAFAQEVTLKPGHCLDNLQCAIVKAAAQADQAKTTADQNKALACLTGSQEKPSSGSQNDEPSLAFKSLQPFW